MAKTKGKAGKAGPRASARSSGPAPSLPMTPERAAGKREYPLLADLPVLPKHRTNRAGEVLMQDVEKQDLEGKKYKVQMPVPFDPSGELQHRNRWGKVLMYQMTLARKVKAPDPLCVTVNDRRYQMHRGVKIIVPWFVVHHFRLNIETHYRQDPHPTVPGRKITLTSQEESENITARPIDACDDFDDDTAHLPQAGEGAEDLDEYGIGIHSQTPDQLAEEAERLVARA